jgi:hypothetical protein
MLDDLYQADTETAINALAAMPPEKPKPVSKWNGWSAPLRGITAGAAESGAMVADLVKGAAQADAAYGGYSAGGMFSLQGDAEKREAELLRAKIDTEGLDTTSGVGTALRDVSRHYRPDPATAGLAESFVFDLTRFISKAMGYTMAAGGVPGAVMLGVDEGMKTADDLMQQGVDKKTRMKVGAVAGVTSAASVVLPVAAGISIPKTVGLWAAGGPGAFMAQQAATREILKNANYADLAQQYDPLDPVGLTVASLIPAGFAGFAVASARRAARAGAVKPVVAPEAQPAATPEPTQPEPTLLTQEQVDAVMVHNLTLAQDVRDATPREPARSEAQDVQLVQDVPPAEPIRSELGQEPIQAPSATPPKAGDMPTTPAFNPQALVTEALNLLSGGKSPGEIIGQMQAEGGKVSPELQNMLIGASEFGGRINELVDQVSALIAQRGAKAQPFDLIAQAVENLRSGTKVEAPKAANPLAARLADIEVRNPTALDAPMTVEFDDKGKPTSTMTMREYLDTVKNEAAEEAADANLIQVAANCFLNGGM